ncbi:MAG: 50S ribosomal protein L10 [Parcubacteria group bacterium]
MKSKSQKQASLGEYKDKLAKSKITIFTAFASQDGAGLGVGPMQELRKKLREDDAEYVVEKKRIISKILKDQKKDIDVSAYEGSLGTIFGYGDQVAPARDVYEFSKTNPSVKLYGGLFDGEYIDEEKVMTLAKLPGRDALIGQFAYMTAFPIRGLVAVLQANIRNLAVVLSQVAQNKA